MAKPNDEDAYYQPYKGFANTLRAWFVAYGIGGPFLIVSQEKIWAQLSQSEVQTVAIFFMIGLLSQVLHTMLFKWAQWELHNNPDEVSLIKENGKPGKQTIESVKFAWQISSVYWFDLIADGVTLISYTFATFYLVTSVVGAPAI